MSKHQILYKTPCEVKCYFEKKMEVLMVLEYWGSTTDLWYNEYFVEVFRRKINILLNNFMFKRIFHILIF